MIIQLLELLTFSSSSELCSYTPSVRAEGSEVLAQLGSQ